MHYVSGVWWRVLIQLHLHFPAWLSYSYISSVSVYSKQHSKLVPRIQNYHGQLWIYYRGEACSSLWVKRSKWRKQNEVLLPFTLKNKSKWERCKYLHRNSLQLLRLWSASLVSFRLSVGFKVSWWLKIKPVWDLKGFCAFKSSLDTLGYPVMLIFAGPNGRKLERNSFCELNCMSAMVLPGLEKHSRPDACLMWLGSIILKIGCGLIQSERY